MACSRLRTKRRCSVTRTLKACVAQSRESSKKLQELFAQHFPGARSVTGRLAVPFLWPCTREIRTGQSALQHAMPEPNDFRMGVVLKSLAWACLLLSRSFDLTLWSFRCAQITLWEMPQSRQCSDFAYGSQRCHFLTSRGMAGKAAALGRHSQASN